MPTSVFGCLLVVHCSLGRFVIGDRGRADCSDWSIVHALEVDDCLWLAILLGVSGSVRLVVCLVNVEGFVSGL